MALIVPVGLNLWSWLITSGLVGPTTLAVTALPLAWVELIAAPAGLLIVARSARTYGVASAALVLLGSLVLYLWTVIALIGLSGAMGEPL